MALPVGSIKKRDRKALHLHVEADTTFATFLFLIMFLRNE
jgi:hypothetical protein